MEKGQIIFCRKCLHLEKGEVFLISRKTQDDRCIILSDLKENDQGKFWMTNTIAPYNEDTLIKDRKSSVIGSEYMYPRFSIYPVNFWKIQLHRRTPSAVPLHKVVCLAIQIRRGELDNQIALARK